MTEAPIISILLPAYNAENYIREAVKSALGQTLSNIEVLCVDDASTDGTREILREFESADPRLRLIVHDRNRGTMAARKTAALASRGKYCMFLDHDDLLNERACEILSARMESANADILSFPVSILPAGGTTAEEAADMERYMNVPHKRMEGEDRFPACFLRHETNIMLWSHIVRGDAARKAYSLASDSQIIQAEDYYAFFFFLLCVDSLEYAPCEKLYTHRLGSGINSGTETDLTRFHRLWTDSIATAMRDLRAYLENARLMEKYGIYWEAISGELALYGVSEMCKSFPRELWAEGIGRYLERWKDMRYPGLARWIADAVEQRESQGVEIQRLRDSLALEKQETVNAKAGMAARDETIRGLTETRAALQGAENALRTQINDLASTLANERCLSQELRRVGDDARARLAQSEKETADAYESANAMSAQVSQTEARLQSLEGTIKAQEAVIAELNAQIAGLNQTAGEREALIAELNAQIAGLNQSAGEREALIAELNQYVGEKEATVADLSEAVRRRDADISTLNAAILERDAQIGELKLGVFGRSEQITRLYAEMNQKDDALAALRAELDETRAKCEALRERSEALRDRSEAAESERATLEQRLSLVLNSRSWKITKPLRRILRHE